MKNIVISIYNGLLSEMIATALHEGGEHLPFRCPIDKKHSVSEQCRAVSADILLLEVAHHIGVDYDTRVKEIDNVKQQLPNCKIVLLCDENSSPDLARKVVQLKKDGVVDGFVYSSVGVKYLTAVLSAF